MTYITTDRVSFKSPYCAGVPDVESPSFPTLPTSSRSLSTENLEPGAFVRSSPTGKRTHVRMRRGRPPSPSQDISDVFAGRAWCAVRLAADNHHGRRARSSVAHSQVISRARRYSLDRGPRLSRRQGCVSSSRRRLNPSSDRRGRVDDPTFATGAEAYLHDPFTSVSSWRNHDADSSPGALRICPR